MGTIHGRAATGLANSGSWAANEDVVAHGAVGERATEAILNEIVSDPRSKAAVFHDLTIPGSRANIDHALVYGSRVLLLDSKRWAPGFYWALTKTSPVHRGWSQFAITDKRTGKKKFPTRSADATLDMARNRLTTTVTALTVTDQPLIVAWPSRKDGRITSWALPLEHSRMITGDRLARTLDRRRYRAKADPRLVDALIALVNT